MKKFDAPEINVVKFANESQVITTSSGYDANNTDFELQFAVRPAKSPRNEFPF